MNAQPRVQTIDDLLALEARSLRAVTAVLYAEQRALKNRAADDLPALAEQKGDLYGDLAAMERQRQMFFSRLGVHPGQTGMQDWLARQGSHAARETWNEILQLAREARDVNVVNGKLIDEQMQTNRQALSVLCAASERAGSYGPDGRPVAFGRYSRQLGSA
ncbi:MAG: flagellar protein FlgN [Rhodocyclaceae bacterium]|nr:flagellar protein FlgN [Rhodocyclaceae bacterium]MBX3670673.1 flagellar protein FlgN [Rhodocyclaceae bacterium]